LHSIQIKYVYISSMETQNTEIQRVCLECKTEYTGRKNQKFCSRMCKTAFNNRISRTRTVQISEINKILYKNWSILQSLYDRFGDDADIDRSLFDYAGYSFKYHTHISSLDEKKIRYCYNFGIQKVKGKSLRIVRGELAGFQENED